MAEVKEAEVIEQQRKLSPFLVGIIILFTLTGVGLSILQIFHLRPFGWVMLNTSYYYVLLGLFISMVFLVCPAVKKHVRRVQWYDYLGFVLILGIFGYFAYKGYDIVLQGWEIRAPLMPSVMAVVAWLLVLEATRRSSGLVLALVCAVFSFYPVFAGFMPGMFQGMNFSLLGTARSHFLGTGAVLGIPTQTFGDLLMGFMLFGVVLQATGGGKFFLDFAFAAMGRAKGGPAKVSVVSSALFGTMSGSAISNVITTGSMTIPAMKKAGYKSAFAGAVECVSSTGGALMPPIMGAVAFIMASFIGVPYGKIVLAAAFPALLYYIGLIAQVDGYARKNDLKGIPKENLPRIWETIKYGWFYIFALFALVGFVFLLRYEGQAPYIVMAVLLICSSIRKETRLTRKSLVAMLVESGKFLATLGAIMGGVGMIVGAMSITGLGHAFSREIVGLAGNNMYLLLLLGAVASFILGMGMTATACYIFLAITVAPALVSLGLNQLAVHLFVLYWGIVSFITPPVAMAAIAASPIAKESPMKIGYHAMKLGSIVYFIPFFFVLNPALILVGPVTDILLSVVTAVIGVVIIAFALSGYIPGIGAIGLPLAALTGAAGIALVAPWRASEIVGVALLGALAVIVVLTRKKAEAKIKVRGGANIP